MNALRWLLLILLAAGLLAACDAPARETLPAATLQLPTTVPAAAETATTVPAAALETAVPAAQETAVALPTPEPAAPAPAAPAPTPAPAPVSDVVPPSPTLTLEQPAAGGVLTPGSVTFSGQISPLPALPPTFRLLVGNEVLLSQPVTLDAAAGTWQVEVTVPPNLAGPAEINVEGSDAVLSAAFDVTMAVDAASAFVTLNRTVPAHVAVGGYTLLLYGDAVNLIDDTLTIAVRAAGCTETVTMVSFPLTGGRWQGQLIVPQTAMAGPACVVAYTGTPGEAAWREARLPVSLLAKGDANGRLLGIGIPDGASLQAGQLLELDGVAIQAPAGGVQLSLQAAGTVDELVLAAGTAEVDSFGFWTLPLQLPPDYSGAAWLLATTGEGESLQETRIAVTIAP